MECRIARLKSEFRDRLHSGLDDEKACCFSAVRRGAIGPSRRFQRLTISVAISGPPDHERAGETFSPSVNRTNQIVLGHVVVKQRWESVLWFRSIPSTKPDIRRSRPPIKKKNDSIRATFHTAWALNLTCQSR